MIYKHILKESVRQFSKATDKAITESSGMTDAKTEEAINKGFKIFKEQQDLEMAKIRRELDENKFNLVEFLGVFVAILSFVIVFINVSLKLNFIQLILAFPLLAIIMLLFIVGLDLIIRKNNNYTHLKWLIGILILYFLIIYFLLRFKEMLL